MSDKDDSIMCECVPLAVYKRKSFEITVCINITSTYKFCSVGKNNSEAELELNKN